MLLNQKRGGLVGVLVEVILHLRRLLILGLGSNSIVRLLGCSTQQACPFHLARNPYCASSYTFAANHNISGYLPPGYNLLRTTLLKRERSNIDRLLEPIRDTWSEKGVSIVSDGWSDSQRRPLINFMAVKEGGPMFLKAVDCSREQRITKNVENNVFTYGECSWISDVVGDVMMVKHFITNHSMRLAMYNEFVPLKLLSVVDTRFASSLVILKRFKLIKQGLQTMVISDKWSSYKEEDVGKAKFVKDKVLDDVWWDHINFILSFTAPIYDMLRACDTDKPCLHLVYDMWDTMIEKNRWNKNNTPLHCLAHSLNPRYYSDQWLHEDPKRVPPHRDEEIMLEKNKCLKRYFEDPEERNKAMIECGKFSTKMRPFSDVDSIQGRWTMDPYTWWAMHGTVAPRIQNLTFKLLAQPASSSYCERNWSTYSFIHSVRRNKMTPQRTEDLVFIHTKVLKIARRRTPQYYEGENKMWDIAGDQFESLGDIGILEVANLALDEPDLEAVIFMDNGGEGAGCGDGDGDGDGDDLVELGSN
ncbi:hypothetical protein Acr_00g0005490 [Actinidia rufa]|uniref:HAT dimerization domain-containing protein n=1 Tax=Actinidia rufa TaxID=165716 RepID=A0A7J0D7R2_9ERIC|nr:hypothetical protein Acr_00g0005490 [Actinidia rufa]